MRLFRFFGPIACWGLLLAACGQEKRPEHTDTLGSGTIEISVDDTYQPVIAEQLRVFDSSYPDAHITARYRPETECVKDLLDKKSRMILITRELNESEKKYCSENAIAPTTLPLVRDAIAVIVHPSSPDSMLSLEQLRGILTGQYKKKYTVVFDNQGSSTVRFAEDSILKGARLGGNVYAAKGNRAVVDYVAQNPDAIGLVGQRFASDTADTAAATSFLTNVRVAYIQDPKTGSFNRPYVDVVALRIYPLTRTLYYINRETWHGLGTGFSNFLAQERGQLLFYHSHMFPLRTSVTIRNAVLNR